jgi:cytidyltransferase-like protein
MTRLVLATGGFDPIHSGHIAYLNAARALGDRLIVALNSDAWLARKKTQAFMPLSERAAVVQALGVVDEIMIDFDDNDGSSCDAIVQLRKRYKSATIVFVNGGDRGKDNTPESRMMQTDNLLEMAWSVGGSHKANSSSWLLNDWKNPKTLRPWGYYRVLHQDGKQVKLKELVVDPGQHLSMQNHSMRAEFWFVTNGTATVYSLDSSSDMELMGVFGQHQHLWIQRNEWHQLCNEHAEPLRMIEIQYGDECAEVDITRLLIDGRA